MRRKQNFDLRTSKPFNITPGQISNRTLYKTILYHINNLNYSDAIPALNELKKNIDNQYHDYKQLEKLITENIDNEAITHVIKDIVNAKSKLT